MAFALTKYRAYGVDVVGATRRRLQRVALEITGLTTDVALDIGADAGTFWTAAKANATYGDLAKSALDHIKAISGRGKLIGFSNTALFARIQAAATSGSAYTVGIVGERPNYTFAASNGATAHFVTLEYELNNDELAVAAQFGG